MEDIELSSADGEALIERIEGERWTAEDRHLVVQIIRLYFGVILALQEAKITVKRLRHLLFGKPPKPAPEETDAQNQPDNNRDDPSESDPVESDAHPTPVAPADAEPTEAAPVTPSQPKGGHRKGTGRLGADAYEGAERVECHHDDLEVGQRCPACGQGRLYSLPPGRQIRINGHGFLSAIRYELEKFRCSACGQVVTAKLPESAGTEKYSPRARAVLAISRTYLALPFYRLQGYQAMLVRRESSLV